MRWFAPWQPMLIGTLLCGAFGMMQLVGWEQYAVVLSGTMVWDAPTHGVVQGMTYIGTWLATAVFAPILLGGGLLWWAVDTARGTGTER